MMEAAFLRMPGGSSIASSSRMRPPSVSRRRPQVICKLGGAQKPTSSNPEDADNTDPQELDGMNIRWKNNKNPFSDGRDLLPFDIEILTPPSRRLGRFRLDPRLNCGDVVDYDGKSYVVRRVTMHYAYRNGTYVVTRKTAEVKTMGRKSLESYLERLYNVDGNVGLEDNH